MKTNVENHQDVVNKVYDLKQKALTGDEEARLELYKLFHFHLGISGIANKAIKEIGGTDNLDVYKNIEIAKHRQNTGKVVLQIAIVAVLFYWFANSNESWYWTFAKAVGLYIAVGFAIFLTGGLKYFRKGKKK
ncbi:hypothetical protein D3C87_935090 [compost metagenome]